MDAALQQCSVSVADAATLDAQRHIERIRVNELRRVCTSDTANQARRFFEPPSIQEEDDNLSRPQNPRIATDTSLTAFAQLAALRLNCERCFISLIDDKTQYIVAEATRTIGLASEDKFEDENDKLSFGQTMLDFKTGVCPGTIACFTSLDSSLDRSSDQVQASKNYYVMNDMSTLEGYTDRSYVAGWPYMKYYAEVPVHSPDGHTIGTLCVVDNKPRDGLDLKGLSILKEISNTVMSHLELCVNKIQRKRAERMIQALGQFVEGRESIRELWLREESTRLPEPRQQHLSLDQRVLKEFGSPNQGRKLLTSDLGILRQLNLDDPTPFRALDNASGKGGVRAPLNRISSLQSTDSLTSSIPTQSDSNVPSADTTNMTSIESAIYAAQVTPPPMKRNASITEITRDEETSNFTPMPESLETVLSRAANLIREAIDLDGVIFQDCSGTQDDRQTLPAKVITWSAKEEHDMESIYLHSGTLRRLCKRFPNGGLLSFDAAGLIRAIPLDTEPPLSKFVTNLNNSTFGDISQDNITAEVCAWLDIDALRLMFPNVASITIYPLWDTRRDKCLAYCIAWSANPARILQRQDVVYMATFSNSIIAQLARMETVAADQAKTAFISSISHELRSPLHGILASIEILRDLVTDDSHNDVLNLIESCGSTLLDTLDNVLEYSQIGRSTDRMEPNQQSPTPQDGPPVAAIDIGRLVEDITTSCLIGMQYSRSINEFRVEIDANEHGREPASDSSLTGPVVICEIAAGCEQLFDTDPAVWKRILMNLLGNAVKYTSSGFILVKFEHHAALVQSTAGLVAQSEVQLTVRDSGKGMSQDYLRHHLFKPFHQESVSNPGTGLGLSIVARLVSSINGEININSDLGVGTEVIVSAKLNSITSGSTEVSDPAPERTMDLTLGFFDLNAIPDFDDPPAGVLSSASEAVLLLRSTILKYASTNNLKTLSAAAIDSAEVDILVIEDSRFRMFPLPRFKKLNKPVIVLCTRFLPDRDQVIFRTDNVVFVPRPFGPRMFKRALAYCQQIRQEVRESLERSPASDFVAPSLNSNLPERNVSVAILPPRIEALATPDLVTGSTISGSPTSVLLVEDNAINLKLLVACVQKMKLDYMTAKNGAEAVEKYSSYAGRIPLIFMDIQMPIMDGTEATQRIRSHERDNSLSRARIVAMTALGTEEAKQLALGCGVDMFLTKPVPLKMVTTLLKEYCDLPRCKTEKEGT